MFYQIGTDQGLMPAPVQLQQLNLYTAERADVVLDFAAHAGERVVMMNQALNVLQFRVAARAPKDTAAIPAVLRPVPRITESTAIRTRVLTLVEKVDYSGYSMMMLLNDAH